MQQITPADLEVHILNAGSENAEKRNNATSFFEEITKTNPQLYTKLMFTLLTTTTIDRVCYLY